MYPYTSIYSRPAPPFRRLSTRKSTLSGPQKDIVNMAGGDHHSFKMDPAVERWSQMHSTMHERFRFTPSKTRGLLLFGILVPVLTFSLARYSDNRWDMRAKTREDSLLRVPPKTEEASEE